MNDQVKPVKIRGTIYWPASTRRMPYPTPIRWMLGNSHAAVAALESPWHRSQNKGRSKGSTSLASRCIRLMPTTAARTLLPVWLVTALKAEAVVGSFSGSSRTRKGLVRL